MILGAVIGGEVLTMDGIVSALIIIAGVVIISLEANKKECQPAKRQAV